MSHVFQDLVGEAHGFTWLHEQSQWSCHHVGPARPWQQFSRSTPALRFAASVCAMKPSQTPPRSRSVLEPRVSRESSVFSAKMHKMHRCVILCVPCTTHGRLVGFGAARPPKHHLHMSTQELGITKRTAGRRGLQICGQPTKALYQASFLFPHLFRPPFRRSPILTWSMPPLV